MSVSLLTTPNRLRARAVGFTFIEALATMAFLSIVIPSVMDGVSLCSSVAKQARQRSLASSLAYEKMNELLVEADWDHGSQSGDFGADYSQYKWASALNDWNDLKLTGMRQLDVTVSWQLSSGRQQSVVASTLVDVELSETTE